jgi:hypothetical protein
MSVRLQDEPFLTRFDEVLGGHGYKKRISGEQISSIGLKVLTSRYL